MKQEDKDLLLRDLCARLPYGVKALFHHKLRGEIKYLDTVITLKYYVRDFIFEFSHNKDLLTNDATFVRLSSEEITQGHPNNYFTPYLRPMSSMTDDEKNEAVKNYGTPYVIYDGVSILTSAGFVDWLNAHHFDYRGLIEKGLALEAPKHMYNTNK